MMKNYELVIERLQPSCGGKDPKEVKVLSVSTDNPLNYVQQLEPAGNLQVETSSSGDIIISLNEGMKHITYTFTEE